MGFVLRFVFGRLAGYGGVGLEDGVDNFSFLSFFQEFCEQVEMMKLFYSDGVWLICVDLVVFEKTANLGLEMFGSRGENRFGIVMYMFVGWGR